MAWKLSEVITHARQLLNDNDAAVGLRYSDEQLRFALNMAMAELYRLRPDAFAGDYTTGVPTYEAADDLSTIDFPVHTLYVNPVTSFIVGWTEVTDDEFTTDGRAAALLQRFAQSLVVGA